MSRAEARLGAQVLSELGCEVEVHNPTSPVGNGYWRISMKMSNPFNPSNPPWVMLVWEEVLVAIRSTQRQW